MNDAPGAWPPRVTVARVHELHAAALAHAGGTPGVRDPGLLESAVDGALTAVLYAREAGELDPLLLAAHLLCYLARNHPFIDGNKRVAWLACEDQLRLVSLRLAATTDDAESLVLAVVAHRVEVHDVVAWLGARLCAYEPGSINPP
jgi:death-on-curing protein